MTGQLSSSWIQRFPVGALALAALVAISVSLSGCRSDHVTVNPNDPNSPQYSYHLHELALLQMTVDDILELERKKQYGKIYDDYTSDAFKQGISRRRFLIMTNCVETYLGELEEYNPNELGFRRDKLKGSKQSLDVLNRKVQRTLGQIEEQLVLVPNGLSFRLNGLYWIAKDKQFLQCIAESPQIERATTPKSELPEEATASTEEAAKSESSETSSAETSASDASPSATKPDGSEAPVSSSGGNAPVPAAPPVQDMKPAEIKKAPLEARPAGAGAVVDQRPTPKKPKKEAKPADPDLEESEKESAHPSESPVAKPATKPPVAVPIDMPSQPEPNHTPD